VAVDLKADDALEPSPVPRTEESDFAREIGRRKAIGFEQRPDLE
jgi:hypothetical protein